MLNNAKYSNQDIIDTIFILFPGIHVLVTKKFKKSVYSYFDIVICKLYRVYKKKGNRTSMCYRAFNI